jgi:Arc/MetJ family transcription regulator
MSRTNIDLDDEMIAEVMRSSVSRRRRRRLTLRCVVWSVLR